MILRKFTTGSVGELTFPFGTLQMDQKDKRVCFSTGNIPQFPEDISSAKKHYIAASVKIKGDGSERPGVDDSDEKEILINDRKRLRNPFF